VCCCRGMHVYCCRGMHVCCCRGMHVWRMCACAVHVGRLLWATCRVYCSGLPMDHLMQVHAAVHTRAHILRICMRKASCCWRTDQHAHRDLCALPQVPATLGHDTTFTYVDVRDAAAAIVR
jgi:hypothetical protein